ncbi:MAG: GlsB/YeaQ/YmgE family stress response membrane protein [Anaerolineae bacterium]
MGIFVLLIIAVLAILVLGKAIGITLGLLFAAFLWMLAGMFAGRIMRGRGYGPLADVLLGLIGGLVGSLVLGLFGIHMGGGILGSVIVGTFGAVIVVYIGRILQGRRVV